MLEFCGSRARGGSAGRLNETDTEPLFSCRRLPVAPERLATRLRPPSRRCARPEGACCPPLATSHRHAGQVESGAAQARCERRPRAHGRGGPCPRSPARRQGPADRQHHQDDRDQQEGQRRAHSQEVAPAVLPGAHHQDVDRVAEGRDEGHRGRQRDTHRHRLRIDPQLLRALHGDRGHDRRHRSPLHRL